MTAVITTPPSADPTLFPSRTTAIPFARLLRVELSKATDTRAARWLLGLSALATIAVVLLPLLRPNDIDQTYGNYLFYAITGATIVLPVVAIMTLTSEWTQRTVLTTFAQEPRRTRIIGAKVSVALLLSVAAMLFSAAVCGVAVAIATVDGRHVSADLGRSAVIGVVLYTLVIMLMGVAFGALVHNTAASIVLFFLAPTVLGIVGGAVGWVNHWLGTTLVFGWVEQGDWDGHVGQILTCVAVWVALPLALGLVRSARREIK